MSTALTPSEVISPAKPGPASPAIPPLRITRLIMHNIKRIKAIVPHAAQEISAI
jgi:hypothetical protein